MIYALGNFVPFLFWGISLLQIASDLFNSINYQHLQKYWARYGESFGELGVTNNECLTSQNLQVIRCQLHSYTQFWNIFCASVVFEQPMEPSYERNFTSRLHMGGPTCCREDPAYAGENPAVRPDLTADLGVKALKWKPCKYPKWGSFQINLFANQLVMRGAFRRTRVTSGPFGKRGWEGHVSTQLLTLPPATPPKQN